MRNLDIDCDESGHHQKVTMKKRQRKPRTVETEEQQNSKVAAYYGHIRWRGVTKEARSEDARQRAVRTWAQRTKKERSEWGRRMVRARYKQRDPVILKKYADGAEVVDIEVINGKRNREIMLELATGDTMRKVGARHDLSAGRIQQIVKTAFKRLKKSKK